MAFFLDLLHFCMWAAWLASLQPHVASIYAGIVAIIVLILVLIFVTAIEVLDFAIWIQFVFDCVFVLFCIFAFLVLVFLFVVVYISVLNTFSPLPPPHCIRTLIQFH